MARKSAQPAPDRPDGSRSRCPVSCALDLLGDKWTLLIVRDMIFLGKTRYLHFQDSPEKIPTNILADRLKKMEALGLVQARPYQNRPPRHDYHLTEKGRALAPILQAMMKWAAKHIPGVFIPSPAQIRRIRRQVAQSTSA